MGKTLIKNSAYVGVILVCCLGFQSASYGGTRTEAKYRANLWAGYFPADELPEDFGHGTQRATVSINAVTARYDVKIVEHHEDDKPDPKEVKTVTSLIHPDTHGTSDPFIEVPAPCLMGCLGGVRRMPNTRQQTVNIEIMQTVKISCLDCRTKKRGHTTPELVVNNLKKEPFAEYSVTYNWKPLAPVCSVQRKVVDLTVTKSEKQFQTKTSFGSCGVQHVLHHVLQLRPLEATTYDLSDTGDVIPHSGREAGQADVERLREAMLNSTPYQKLIQNPAMRGCSAVENDAHAECYQDELLGTDCSTAIYHVRVTVDTGEVTSGVLLVPCDAEAILLYENLVVYQQVALAGAASAGDVTAGNWWQPPGDTVIRESMKRASRHLIKPEDIISQEEKMRNLQRRVSVGDFNQFLVRRQSQQSTDGIKSLFH